MADGGREANSAAALLEAVTPFNDVLEFHPVPAVDVEEGVGILGKAFALRDSL